MATTDLGLILPEDSTLVQNTMVKFREFANNVNDVLHTHVVDGTDSAVAAAINDTTSTTRTALNSWQTANPILTVGRTTDFALTSNGYTTITWNTSAGTTSMLQSSSTRLVAPKAGWYRLDCLLVFSNVAGGMRGVRMTYKTSSGATTIIHRGAYDSSPNSAFFSQVEGHVVFNMATNSYFLVEAEVQQSAVGVVLKGGESSRASLEFIK